MKKTITFEALHEVIQIVMGWTNSHLYELKVNGVRIGQPLDEFDLGFGEELINDATVILESVLSQINQHLRFWR